MAMIAFGLGYKVVLQAARTSPIALINQGRLHKDYTTTIQYSACVNGSLS